MPKVRNPREKIADQPDDSPACRNHPKNVAECLCDRCGTFICPVCETRIGSRVICPDCFLVLAKNPERSGYPTTRFSWTGLILHMTFFSFFVPFLCFITLATAFAARSKILKSGTRHGLKSVYYAGGINLMLAVVHIFVLLGS
ncbi:MAG: hypothetical protein Kow00107_08560 [Planctomycetota bacterium]